MHAIAQTFNKRRGSKITTILTGERRRRRGSDIRFSTAEEKKGKN